MAYVDASALVKLVIEEVQSQELAEALAGFGRRLSSELVVTEVGRAGLRASGNAGLRRAEIVCAGVDLQPISRAVLDRAAALDPPALRALAAVHLATALGAPTPPVVVAYDRRLLDAARRLGLETSSPGQS